MNADLERIVERVFANDPDAIDALLRRIRPLVYRWALVRVADADDAEDVAQAVLLRVRDRIGSYERESRFTTWLYRVTANEATQVHRRRGALHRMIVKLQVRIGPRTSGRREDPLAAIEDAQARTRIALLLRGLSRSQRTMVDLVDLQGYTPAQAAEMMQLNANTARVHLLRGRRTLRRTILDARVEAGVETGATVSARTDPGEITPLESR